MARYLAQSISLLWIGTQHVLKKILYLAGDTLVDVVDLLPELFEVLVDDEFVIFIAWGCFQEWELAVKHDEDYNTEREDIGLSSIVYSVVLDFRGHVLPCSLENRQLLNLFVCGIAKVSKLQVELVVWEDVFWFDIEMNYSILVNIRKSVY